MENSGANDQIERISDVMVQLFSVLGRSKSTEVALRRIVAAFLVVLFGAGPMLPVLALDRAPSDIPACCKKDGTHKCSVRHSHTDSQNNSGEPSVRAVCPFSSHAEQAIVGQQSVVPSTVRSVASVVLRSPRLPLTQQTARISAVSAANPKRGPPEPGL